MNNNLNILKEKATEFSQAFAMYLESNEALLQDNKSEEKIGKLIEQNALIIKQNEEILSAIRLLNDSLSRGEMVFESKVNNNQPTQEILHEIRNAEPTSYTDNETEQPTNEVEQPVSNLEQEQSLDISTQEADTLQEASNIVYEQPSQAEQLSIATEQIPNTEEQQIETSEQLSSKQEKPTSSVLEFLHNRVINDNSKSNKEVEKAVKTPHKTEPIEGDLFATNQPTSIFEQFENKTKSDLRTAVGVSEKFLFINDLFSGNIRLCNEFINKLNDCQTLESSMQIIDDYQKDYKWPKTSLAYTTLESLISKRFSV